MSLSKPLTKLFSFSFARATPSAAAAARSLRRRTNPLLPPSPSSLSASLLSLHNTVLKLLYSNDLAEASLLLRHSFYSNSPPSVHTVNAALRSLLLSSRHSDFLSLHRFSLQSGMSPTVTTHNLLLQCYIRLRRIDTALEQLRLLHKDDSIVTPSPSSYRIVIRGLVENGRINEAVKLKNEMLEKGFVGPDWKVYNFLMGGFAKVGNGDEVIALFEELKQKLGEDDAKVSHQVICGNLMKGYFLKGMEKEAMEFYNEVMMRDDDLGFKFGVDGYNSALDALGRNAKLNEAIKLFERMASEHNPPRRIALDCESFDLMVNAYCYAGEFGNAVTALGKMEEKNIRPGVKSYNNLIDHLAKNGLVAMAEELWRGMVSKNVDPDETTYVLLMNACFGANRVNDGYEYFNKLVESGFKPSVIAHEMVINGLVDAGEVDTAREVFDKMPDRGVKPSTKCYEVLMKGYVKVGSLENGMKLAKWMFLDDKVILSDEMEELLLGELRKGGREEEMEKLYKEVEREKAETAAREAEERERRKAVEREERERRRAELAAQEAAAAAASKAAIEAILGSRRSDDAMEEAAMDSTRKSSELIKKIGGSGDENVEIKDEEI